MRSSAQLKSSQGKPTPISVCKCSALDGLTQVMRTSGTAQACCRPRAARVRCPTWLTTVRSHASCDGPESVKKTVAGAEVTCR
jgi:hypothetical protein